MNFKPLQYIFKPGSNPHGPTLLLLHGTGGDEQDLLPLAESFHTGYNLLSVRGNVLEHGMPRFFRRLGMGIFDEKDVHFRTHELVHFLQQIAAEKNFNAHNVIALGYSNGANIAGAILLLYPELLAGAILFRPMQPLQGLEDSFETARQQPVFMSTGAMDSTVAPEAGESYATLLEANGFKISRYELPAGHQLTEEDIQLASHWLKDNFKV